MRHQRFAEWRTSLLKRTNINAVLKMVRQYLAGDLSHLEMQLDFPYEVGQRYRKMVAEDREYAELIYDRLVEKGVDGGRDLSEEEFRQRIKEIYDDVIDIAKGGFL